MSVEKRRERGETDALRCSQKANSKQQPSINNSYHWVYDMGQIPRAVPAQLLEPTSKFHKEKGKAKGDFTHIGDQVLLLLRQLSEHKDHQYDSQAYANKFSELFHEGYKGYVVVFVDCDN